MSKILVTGDMGFIGHHLCELLLEKGLEYDGCDLFRGDDIRKPIPNEGYTHIFHLAAKRSVPIGEKRPKEFIMTNCWGTANVMKTFPDARVLNISSSSAEEVRSVYGATKAFAETMGNQHVNCLNVRLYNVFGPGQKPDTGAVFPTFMSCKANGRKPVVYGDGLQKRDFTYVKDVVHNLYTLMFDSKETGLRHLGYGDSISVMDLLYHIYDGKMPEVLSKPSRGFEIVDSKSPEPMEVIYGRRPGIVLTKQWWEESQ